MALLNPTFLASRDYSAMEDRTAFVLGGSLQDGVYNSGDLAVTQRASSANMSVDVAAGWALITGSNPGNRGAYTVRNDAVVNVPLAASHATLPRVDQIVVKVNDSVDGADSSDIPQIMVLAGTPTSGATLTNRSGAVDPLPYSCLRLADVLVGAGVTTIANANIISRRSFARGWRGAEYVGGQIFNSATFTKLGDGSRDLIYESRGRPIEVTFTAYFTQANTAGDASFGVAIDGSLPGGSWPSRTTLVGAGSTISFTQVLYPTAGRRVIYPLVNVQGGNNCHVFSSFLGAKELLN